MNFNYLPSKKTLDELLHADFETGRLYWKERDAKWFKKESDRKTWNTQYSGEEAFSVLTRGYFVGGLFYKLYRAHRIIYKMYYGVDPVQVDHINGVRSDNRILNLRSVTNQENSRNQKLRSTNISTFQGVCFHKPTKKWRSYINLNGKQIHLGLFENIEEASLVRKQAEIKYGFHNNHGRNK
jgi:HNH endonuclease